VAVVGGGGGAATGPPPPDEPPALPGEPDEPPPTSTQRADVGAGASRTTTHRETAGGAPDHRFLGLSASVIASRVLAVHVSLLARRVHRPR
jgi:hypothetical protein